MKAWILCLAFLVLGGVAVSLCPCTASAAADNRELARFHYKKASQLYDLGRFDEALAEYEQAYTLHEDPSLLFNMAQTCRRKGDLKRALDLYKNYLVKEPESPMRSEVESRIKALKAQIEQGEKPTAETAPVVPPTVAPTTPGHALEPPAPVPPVAPAPAPTPVRETPPTPAPSAASPTPVPFFAPPGATPSLAASPATAAPAAPSYPLAAPGTYPPAQPQAGPGTLPTTTPGYDQAPPASPVFPAPVVPEPAPSPPVPAAFAQQSAPAYSPARETSSSGLPLMITGGIVTAGGLVCVALGIYNAVQVKTLSDRVTTGPTFNPSDDTQGKRAEKFEKIELGVGIGATALGAILFTTGLVQYFSEPSKLAVVPLVQPNGAMLAATGGF